MKTPPDKTVVLTYVSHPMPKTEERWEARLTFPSGSEASSVLTLSVADGNGVPVPQGTFELSGRKLQVENGTASLTYADFIAGIHETGLWLRRPNMMPVPGGLTFA